jgi:quercetin dioxygenase-like cupin family protein
VTNLVMIKFAVEPGGTFGWHQHGGPVWAIVTSGTLTIYSSDDPSCTPHYYPAGTAFLDPGDHTHRGVNETGQPVEVYTTFMLPAGGLTRIDAPDPGVCN